mmetsp:Transcript_26924/g.88339  ORF Transcript_26924/g.88339 Transcript_26924/m.88339 type:complete len:206 (-) Transcript_26924:55-672(-)
MMALSRYFFPEAGEEFNLWMRASISPVRGRRVSKRHCCGFARTARRITRPLRLDRAPRLRLVSVLCKALREQARHAALQVHHHPRLVLRESIPNLALRLPDDPVNLRLVVLHPRLQIRLVDVRRSLQIVPPERDYENELRLVIEGHPCNHEICDALQSREHRQYHPELAPRAVVVSLLLRFVALVRRIEVPEPEREPGEDARPQH